MSGGPAEPPVNMWSVTGPDGTVATGWFLVPLRLFLGVTFLFAGLQKLADPQFLDTTSPTSIHAQLVGAARSSPIHALISHLVPISSAVGLVIAVGEVAIGVGVLVGLLMRVAAVAGMALSFGLFLTVSFHSSPYFTGSDIVFFFAWTPLVLAGAAGAPALDTWLADRRSGLPARSGALPRRAVLSAGAVTGLVAAFVVVTGGVTAAVGRMVGGTSSSGGGGSKPLSATPTTAATGHSDHRRHHGEPDHHHRRGTVGHRHRPVIGGSGRRFGHVHRSGLRRSVARHPADGRRLRRLRRRLPPRRMHGGLPAVRTAHRLPVPRLGVRRRHRRRDQRTGHPRTHHDLRDQGFQR